MNTKIDIEEYNSLLVKKGIGIGVLLSTVIVFFIIGIFQSLDYKFMSPKSLEAHDLMVVIEHDNALALDDENIELEYGVENEDIDLNFEEGKTLEDLKKEEAELLKEIELKPEDFEKEA